MALASYIAREAVRLPPLVEIGGAAEALNALFAMVGDARIVAIGESFHHTHEQLALRQALVQHLVSRLGFSAILLEVLTPGPNALDAFVRRGVGNAESALIATGARMWRNKETASLLCWLQTHNAAGGAPPVAVHGLDALAIGPLIRDLLAKVRPAESERIAALSLGFDIDGRSDQAAFNAMHERDRTALEQLAAAAPAADESGCVVQAALKMLRAGLSGWTEGFALRDQAMAEAAARQIERNTPDAKFIILSHNTHIAAMASSTAPTHPPMGALLRARYGDAYFAIGTAFGQAAFKPPIYGVSEFAGDPRCADQAFAPLGAPAALVDLRGASRTESLRLQGVGVGPLPYTEYPSPAAFDALAYVNLLTNAHQLVDTELDLDAGAVDATRR